MNDYKQRFFELALSRGNLRFGEFTLKSGRVSPYFFNAGGFDDGESLGALAECYADAIADSGVGFDILFGPAYKGIPLAAVTAVALAQRHGRNVGYAYNRKEAKDHGEGGVVVGASLAGRVLIIDDVISAGTSARESIELIRKAGAEVAGIAIALDRQERGEGEGSAELSAELSADMSAMEELSGRHGFPCIAIARLDDLIRFLGNSDKIAGDSNEASPDADFDLEAIRRYRERYGA